jgi:hypothetical protein
LKGIEMPYVRITKEEMDGKLNTEKGWIETFSGNEFVYDFSLSKKPIVIKVASSIRRDTNKGRNKGADAIRVYAVQKDSMKRTGYRVVRGLIKQKRVNRMTNWRKHLETAVYDVMKRANIVYDKMNK